MNSQVARRGIIAGMAGGVVMAMWSMLVLAATGAGFWQPLDLIAHTVWRGAPLDGTFSAGALVLGMVIHMMTSAMLGIVIAAVTEKASGVGALAAGMAAGAGVWLVNQYVVWRVIDTSAAHRFTPWVFALGHLMYGVATALVALRLAAHIAGGRHDTPAARRVVTAGH